MIRIDKLRTLHRAIAPWLLPPLLFLAVTGMIYRIGRSWFGMSKETGNEIVRLHSGEWFVGSHASVVYLLLVGGGLLFLVGSGLWMWFGSPAKGAKRSSHRALAITFALPLIVSSVTGMAFHAGAKWFAWDEPVLDILMSLHQGTWLGKELRVYYIILLGGGLIGLCLTGLRLCFRAAASRSRKEKDTSRA